jgi:hypothetical protein
LAGFKKKSCTPSEYLTMRESGTIATSFAIMIPDLARNGWSRDRNRQSVSR